MAETGKGFDAGSIFVAIKTQISDLEKGLTKALVTTSFGQDFYFSSPLLSTFHLRCERELGYRVGDLRDAPAFLPHLHHSVFEPARDVRRIDWKDPRDP